MRQWIITGFEAHMLTLFVDNYIEAKESKGSEPEQWAIDLRDRLVEIEGTHDDLLLSTLPKRPISP